MSPLNPIPTPVRGGGDKLNYMSVPSVGRPGRGGGLGRRRRRFTLKLFAAEEHL